MNPGTLRESSSKIRLAVPRGERLERKAPRHVGAEGRIALGGHPAVRALGAEDSGKGVRGADPAGRPISPPSPPAQTHPALPAFTVGGWTMVARPHRTPGRRTRGAASAAGASP